MNAIVSSMGENNGYMKIMFLIPEIKSGGAEQTVTNLIGYIRNYYPNIEVCECVMHMDDNYDKPDYVIRLKNDMHRKNGIICKFICKLKQIIEVCKLKKTLGIDVTVSFLPGADFINILSRTKFNGKAIVSLRNNPSETFHSNRFIVRHFHKYIIQRADYVVALSHNVREEAINAFSISPKKITSIYNPIPKQREINEPDLINKLHKEGKKVIVTVGRLCPQKGQWHLIKAVYEVKKKKDNAVLLILGTGDLKDTFAKLIKKYRLDNSVYFTGFVDDAMAYIKYSDLFVFPSQFEGLGNVLIETLSLGQAIIATDCEFGPREILDKTIGCKKLTEYEYVKYGILVPVGSKEISDVIEPEEKELSKAILSLLNNEELIELYRNRALERAKDFEPEHITREWMYVFNSVAKTNV